MRALPVHGLRETVRFCVFSGLLLLAHIADAHTGAPTPTNSAVQELHLGPQRIRFTLSDEPALKLFGAQVRAALEQEHAQATPRHSLARKYRRGLQAIERLLTKALNSTDAAQRATCLQNVLEIVAAINNDQRPLLPNVDVVTTPLAFAARLHSPVGRGHQSAANLAPGSDSDLSRREPLPSTFWQRPANIPQEDLYRGFGRTNWVRLEDKLCSYTGPKQSYGLNPGFEVECDGERIKLKFAEVSAEPFAARVFAAIGYHVEPTDYASHVNVRYDRRIFREFNSRKDVTTRFTLFGLVPLYTLQLQKRFDPFDSIAWAVLKDGRHWTGRELKQQLFRDHSSPHPEDDERNFRPEIESALDYLVTVPANVQVREADVKSIGPWDFGQLDHPGRRELRGLGLLAAWLGWFDTRFDNTRLRRTKAGSEVQLAHCITDLGGVLGETGGLLYSRGELPNAFPWTFTRAPLWQGPHHLARPLRINGFRPIEFTASFAEMTLDDARWMARLLAQLTQTQLLQALLAAGYDSAEARLYLEKLLSRRDRMLIDLGLAGEIPLSRPCGTDHEFSYNPVQEGPISVAVPGIGMVRAPVGCKSLVRGRLLSAPPTTKDSPGAVSLSHSSPRLGSSARTHAN